MTLDHDALRELAAAYAFGTLDPAELRQHTLRVGLSMDATIDVGD